MEKGVYLLNTFDWIIILSLGLAAFRGYKTGLVRQLALLIGFFLAIWIAYTFSSDLAPVLKDAFPIFDPNSSIWMKLLPIETIETMIYRSVSFLILFVAVKIAVWFLAKLVDSIVKIPLVATVNRVGGVLFSSLQIVLLAFVIVHLMNYLPFDGTESTLQNSWIASGILSISPQITEAMKSW